MDEPIARKRGIKKKHIYSIVGIVAILFIFFELVFGSSSSIIGVNLNEITISEVRHDKFHNYVNVVGRVEPIEIIYLDAIEGGRVEELMLEEGAMVKKNDIILKLSNNELNLRILNTEAQLAEQINFLRNTQIQMEQEKIRLKQERLNLEYSLKKKERDYNRKKSLYADEYISEEDFFTAKEDFELTKGNLALVKERQKQDSLFRNVQVKQMDNNIEKMRLNLDLVHNRLDNLLVKAPATGQLGILNAVVGQNIRQGQRVGQLNILSSYKVVAEIDEHYIDRVRTQLPSHFVWRGDTSYLKIKKVYPEVRSGRFEVDLSFVSNQPKEVRAGQTYQVTVELGQPQDAVIIPRGSFYQSTGGQWIFVVNKNGTEAVKRKIRIGKQNPHHYEVLEGLEDGERVITSSYVTYENVDRLVLE